jgi:enoyl-CoA hydratase/carnithine racemase
MAGLRRTFRALGRAPIAPAEREELEALRSEAFGSEDAREARAAMREKRSPRWRGR